MVDQYKKKMKYLIHPVKTSKDEIKQPQLAIEGIIPKLGSSIIISGKSGSGKSVLLYNLMTRKEFYLGSFDKIILVSPTAEQDDVQIALKIPASCVFTDLKEAVQALSIIEKFQTTQIEKVGSGKARKICIIYDDVVGHTRFMNSPEFVGSFIRSRHWNCTTFLLTQSFMRVPRICRLQASFICFFPLSRSEAATVVDEFCPPRITPNQFETMLMDVLEEKYQFFVINMRVPIAVRYRKGLGEIINIDDYIKKKRDDVEIKEDP
jgi:hypothetical protein